MRDAHRWVGVLCSLVLVAAGCGSGRSSEAAFRDQANGICRDVRQLRRSVDFSTASGFDTGLTGMRHAVNRLARLHPRPDDARTFRDLLAKLRGINALLDGNRVELLRLEHRLRVSSGRSAARTIKRFRALVVPLASDGLRAAADARALRLGVCATDLSGGAPFPPPTGGRPT